jgi:hypothetical protein
MNQAFQKFLNLSTQDQRDVFEAEAEELDTLPTYVEKDFWVCLVLDILYNGLSGDHPRLLFKGGTSLSKAYGLIRRFSEDVDFTVFREDLGFGEDQNPASPDLSGKKRKRVCDDIKTATSRYICSELKDDLSEAVHKVAPVCEVVIDEDDQDKSTLLFQYPSLFEDDFSAYVQPRVKLEGGGRSALDPHENLSIQPYIAKTLKDWDLTVADIITISPERTFWDKVMILHGWYCGYRDENRLPKDRQRLSRHCYDVAMIYKAESGKKAIANVSLREDVRNHAQLFFNRGWMKLEEAIPGSIRLLPTEQLAKALKQDYQAMQGMMLGDVPDFNDILKELSELEAELNRFS